MTTTEAFDKMLNEAYNLTEKDYEDLGVKPHFFVKLRQDHKRGQVTLNRMEFALIKTGYDKTVVESWEKVCI